MPPTSYIVYKARHSTQENNQFCSMLIASGKTDCFTHCEKSKHKSRGGTSYNGFYGEASSELQKVYLFQTSGVWKGLGFQ